MKKRDNQWKDALLDGLVELVLYAVIFGVGILVIALFAWLGIDTIDAEPDIIGFVVLLAIGVVGYGIHKIVKRKKNENKTRKDNDGNNTPLNHGK